MSKAILRQVEAKTQARGLTFALIKELGYRHHDQFGYAFPSLAYLADKLRVSVRTIQRHLGKLERLGELLIERVHGRGLNNRYYLKLLGIAPDPTKKHDRYRRWLRAVLRAKRDADDTAAKNMTESPPLTQTLIDQTGAGADAPPRCAGYPRQGSPEAKRWCDYHRRTHFPV
jgi:DNA-binding MarR family transcriptional regulator